MVDFALNLYFANTKAAAEPRATEIMVEPRATNKEV